MSDIKIFVSHRIDKSSKLLDNPLFVNVRCGAYYDNDESSLLGDDTGDNISEKRKSFCELTVHYWAWKNQKADYYGLCHYRRYLSFAEREYEENKFGVVEYPFIDETYAERFGLIEKVMRKEIEKYDLITNKFIPLEQTGDYESVFDYCKKDVGGYKTKDIDILYDIVNEKYPDDLKYVKDFFEGKENCWYNCFIMNEKLFNQYSEWLFSILFELENRVDISEYTQEQMRMCGVLAERLFGAYINKLIQEGKTKICFRQLTYIKDTSINLLEDSKREYKNIVIPINNISYHLVTVTIQSIIDTKKQSGYRICLLNDGVTESIKIIIDKHFRNISDISIIWIDTSIYIDKYISECPMCDRTNANYFTVFDLFDEYEKIVFLTPGMVVKDDLTELFMMDLNGKCIGATLDLVAISEANNTIGYNQGYTSEYLLDELNLLSKFIFYSTDIMLMDIKKIRNEYSTMSIIELIYLGQYKKVFTDIINRKFVNAIQKIDLEWNGFISDTEDIASWIRVFTPNSMWEEFQKSTKKNKIVNYSRYWPFTNEKGVSECAEFWMIARKTPFYEAIVKLIVSNRENIAGSHVYTRRPRKYDKYISSKTRESILRRYPQGTWRRKVIDIISEIFVIKG